MNRLRRLWRRRRQPVRLERCAVCGRELTRKDEHEVRAYAADAAEHEIREMGGGSYVSDTYCGRHCLGGCSRKRPCPPVL